MSAGGLRRAKSSSKLMLKYFSNSKLVRNLMNGVPNNPGTDVAHHTSILIFSCRTRDPESFSILFFFFNFIRMHNLSGNYPAYSSLFPPWRIVVSRQESENPSQTYKI